MPYSKHLAHTLFILGIGLFTLGTASAKTCTMQEYEAADELSDHLDDWEKLDQFVTQYGHCDDGVIAEGLSQDVISLLVAHWSQMPQLAEYAQKNRKLLPFVLRHIDTTLDGKDLQELATLASSSCQKSEQALCKKLKQAADHAFAEQAAHK